MKESPLTHNDFWLDRWILCKRFVQSINRAALNNWSGHMDIKQNPFSFYDFLGYFTPGALFVYGAMWSLNHSNSEVKPLQQIAESIGLEKAEAYVLFILLSYAIGHLLNFLSSITVERYALWAMGFPSKYLLEVPRNGYFHSESKKKLRFLVRIFVFFILLPISLWDLLLGKLLGFRELYSKSLDPLLAALIRGKIAALIKSKGGVKDLTSYGNADNTDFFHYAYHYAVENAPNHLPKMQNYVALYGFLRTLSLLCVIVFWALAWNFLNQQTLSFTPIYQLCLTSSICYLFFMAFVKFYRRFSLEALMAASVSYIE
jgi:hypothetical protein